MSLLQSRFKRSVKGRTGILDQTTNLLEGIVETSYNLSKETLVVVSRWPYFSKFASTKIFLCLPETHKEYFLISRHGHIKLQTQQGLKSFVEPQRMKKMSFQNCPQNQVALNVQSPHYLEALKA